MLRGPIFVGGVSGSGKAQLCAMLSSHPDVVFTRRTYMWTRFYNRYGDLGQSRNFERCLAAMLGHKPTLALRPDPDRIRREFWQGEPTYARLFALFHDHYAEHVGKRRWGDQLGFVEAFADAILSAYPGAQIVHLIRNPHDRYAASIARMRRRTGKIGQSLAAWLHSTALARRNAQRYPDQYKVVRYESLCADLERTVREICAFLGEDFVPEMLNHKGSLPITDDDELDEGSDLDTWGAPLDDCRRSAISKRELAFVHICAGKALADCGYDLKPPQLAVSERLLFYTVDLPVNLASMLWWRLFRAGQITPQ